MSIDVAQVVGVLKESRKYKSLCEETLTRVASWAAARSKRNKEAAKRAKTKLHQVYGAYLGHWNPREAAGLLDQFAAAASADDVRRICRDIMFMHASTRERLQVLDGIYARIFEVTGNPQRVLDIGCGFQPFALPWMGVRAEHEYMGTEIDTRIVEVVNRFLQMMRQTGAVRAQDVLANMPTDEVDVAFLLKMLPCLEQQEKGCSEGILRSLNAKFVVVSLPMRTLSGRDVGMDEHYRRVMDEVLRDSTWPVTRFEMGHELFYILDKRR